MNTTDLSYSVTRALLESAVREGSGHETHGEPVRPAFTITISREAGAGGTTVAKEVGQRLGWPVYDQEILDKIAEEVKRPAFQYRALDERPVGWLETIVAGLASDYQVSPSAYFKYLVGVIRGLGKIGHCLIVGRGSFCILPPETTLRVRLVAAPAHRVRVIAESMSLDAKSAARWIDHTDRDRGEFVKLHFGVDQANAENYDLVVNTSRLSTAEAARVIVETLRLFEERAEAEKRAVAP